MATKTVKISEDIYEELMFLKGTDIRESMTTTVGNLIDEHRKSDVNDITLEKQNSLFFVCINERRRVVPTFSKNTQIIRLKNELHEKLNSLKMHPEETLNFVLFRLIAAHYENKPIYRVFTGHGCGNCEQLKDFVASKLLKIPEISENVYFDLVNCQDHLKEAEEYNVAVMPLSILYDSNGKHVWHASGWHDYNEVQKQIMKIVSKDAATCEKDSAICEYENVGQHIAVFRKVYENICRLKQFGEESEASVIDRLVVDSSTSLTVTYTKEPTDEEYQIDVSQKAKEKLDIIKIAHQFESYDETLWRIMWNKTNRAAEKANKAAERKNRKKLTDI